MRLHRKEIERERKATSYIDAVIGLLERDAKTTGRRRL